MDTQEISVTVYMESQIISGSISLQEHVRLSDYMNSTATFLRITDGVIYYPKEEKTVLNKKKTASKEIYINREAIQMITTIDSNTAKGVCANTKSYYPYVEKTPSKVIINTSNLEIEGSVYLSSKEGIDQLLEKGRTFLPCTKVKMHDFHKDRLIDAGFLAINKKQIQSMMAA